MCRERSSSVIDVAISAVVIASPAFAMTSIVISDLIRDPFKTEPQFAMDCVLLLHKRYIHVPFLRPMLRRNDAKEIKSVVITRLDRVNQPVSIRAIS